MGEYFWTLPKGFEKNIMKGHKNIKNNIMEGHKNINNNIMEGHKNKMIRFIRNILFINEIKKDEILKNIFNLG